MRVYVFNRGISSNVGDKLINYVITRDLQRQGFSVRNNSEHYIPGGFFGNLRSHFISYLDDLYKVNGSDMVIIGGGNLIMDTRNVGIRWSIHQFWLSTICIVLRKPYYYVSVGVNPLQQYLSKVLYKFSLKNALGISARDSYSKSYIAELTGREDIRLVPDPVLNISKVVPVEITAKRKKYVGICPIQLYPKVTQDVNLHEKFISVNRGLIEVMLEMGYKVHVFINSLEDDKQTLVELSRDLYHEDLVIIPEFKTIFDYLDFIAKLDFLFSARMHAVICATSYKIPAIGFGWQPKMYHFFNDLGLSGYVNILEDLNSKTKDELVQVYSEAMRNSLVFSSNFIPPDFDLVSLITH